MIIRISKFKKILISVLFCFTITALLLTSISKPKMASADELKYSPTKMLTLSEQKTYNYYYMNSGNMSDYVGVYVKYVQVIGIGGVGDNAYKYDNDEIWSIVTNSTSSNPRTIVMFLYAKVADNIKMASKNGYASITSNLGMRTETGYGTSSSRDKADKMSAYLYSGSSATVDMSHSDFASISTVEYSGNGFTDTSYRSVAITMNKVESDYLMLKLQAEHVSNSWYSTSTVLYVKQPSFTVTSSDNTAPQIDFDIDTGWSNKNKTLTINVADLESGVQYISYNGSNLEFESISDDTKTASATIDIPNNGTYTFTVTDNVGNSATYTYTESKIERVVPVFDVNVASLCNCFDLEFTASFGSAESPESFYFTIDGSEPTKNSMPLTAVNNVVLAEYGHYVIKAKGFDEAGNETEVKSYEFDCVYDGEYQINVSTVGGGKENCGAEVSESVLNASGLYSYTLDFDVLDGYDFYKILINGRESNITTSGTVIVAYGPMDIVVVTRKFATLFNQSEYVYNPFGVQPSFTVSEDDLSYSDFIVKFYKDGIEAGFGDAGIYTITWSIDNEYYIGSGEFEVEISKKLVTVSDIKTEYEYSEQFNFEYELSENLESISVRFTLNEEEVTPLKPATYNYEFICSDSNYAVSQSGTIKINKKLVELSVSGIDEFDGEEHLPTISVEKGLDYTFTMKLNGVEVDNLFDAGEYSYTLSVTENELYEGEIEGVITVNKRKVTIKADNLSSVYGDALKTLTYTVENGISALPKFELIKEEGKLARSYLITIIEQDLSNFEVTYENASYEILKRDLYVFANEGQFKYYGEQEKELTYYTVNLVDGDVLEGELEREEGENVGLYTIRQGTLSHSQYNISYTDAKFAVLQDQVVIKAKFEEKTFGDADPTLEYSVLYGSLKEGEYVVLEREVGEDAGVYLINAFKIFSSENEDITNNYIIIPIDGEFRINKKLVKVYADAVSTEYGTNVELSFTLEDGFDVTFDGEITREQGENVGNYNILLGTLNNKNYQIEFISATYQIMPKKLTVTANEVEKLYGEEDFLSYTAEGLINGDTLAGSLSREEGENVGVYQINLGTLNNFNYEIEFISAELLIKQATITVRVDDKEKVYGEEDPEFTYTVNGLKNGETVVITIDREEGENAGEYVISPESVNNENYLLDKVNSSNGKLVVGKTTVDFNVFDTTVIYNGEANLVEVEANDLELRYEYYDEFGNQKESAVDVGTYFVKVIYDGDENHFGKEKTVTLTINKKMVTILVDLKPIKYTGTLITPIYTLSDDIAVIVKFDGDKKPIEKGKYTFTITQDENEKNMYINYRGTLTIN